MRTVVAVAFLSLTSALFAQTNAYTTQSLVPSLSLRVEPRDADTIKLIVTNTGPRNIVAYDVGCGDNHIGKSFLLASKSEPAVLAPGESTTLISGIMHKPIPRAQAAYRPEAPVCTDMMVFAALLQDGTFEGDKALGQQLKQRRAAYRTQMKRVAAVLDEIPETGSFRTQIEAAQQAIEKLSNLPSSREDGTQGTFDEMTSQKAQREAALSDLSECVRVLTELAKEEDAGKILPGDHDKLLRNLKKRYNDRVTAFQNEAKLEVNQ